MDDEKKIFSTNLRKYMELYNVDRNKLAQAMNLPYSTINEWYTGTVYPRLDRLTKLAEVLGVSKSALIEDPNSTKLKGIPILGRIPAGVPIEVAQDEYTIDYLRPPMNWNHDVTNYFALIVSGDSMANEYNDGDVIIFKKDVSEFSGKDCCVLIDNNDATFKRVIKTSDGGILLQPLNVNNSSGFLPVHLTLEDCISRSVKILGVATNSFKSIN